MLVMIIFVQNKQIS